MTFHPPLKLNFERLLAGRSAKAGVMGHSMKRSQHAGHIIAHSVALRHRSSGKGFSLHFIVLKINVEIELSGSITIVRVMLGSVSAPMRCIILQYIR
jgi:hypothetical protein